MTLLYFTVENLFRKKTVKVSRPALGRILLIQMHVEFCRCPSVKANLFLNKFLSTDPLILKGQVRKTQYLIPARPEIGEVLATNAGKFYTV